MDRESLPDEEALSSHESATPADERATASPLPDDPWAGGIDEETMPLAAGAESARITGPRRPIETSALEEWLARTARHAALQETDAPDSAAEAAADDEAVAARAAESAGEDFAAEAAADDEAVAARAAESAGEEFAAEAAADDEAVAAKAAESADEVVAVELPVERQELARVLTGAGFPEHAVRQLCAVSTALLASQTDARTHGVSQTRATDEELVAAAEGLLVLQRWSDAALSGVLVDLAEATGDELLARKDVVSPDELSKTARERWCAETKSILAHEVQLLTGWGIQDCHDRVGFALGPRQSVAIPLAALSGGETDWRQVRIWWQACRRMPVEVAAQVAAHMFGPDSDRARAARDSGIDPERQARASLGETKDTLARLVAALLGEDPKAAREERRAAVSRRDAYAEIQDDGTGQVTVTAGTSSVAAAIDRIDRVARAVKAGGDSRTLAQLRADVAMSLLIHGTTTSPGEKTVAGPVDGVADCTCRHASPSTSTPSANRGCGVDDDVDPDRAAPGSVSAGAVGSGPGRGADPPGGQSADCDGRLGAAARDRPTGRGDPVQGDLLGRVDDNISRILAGQPPANVDVIVPLDVLLNSESTGVGAIPGHGYLSAEEVRELAVQCGGIFHRLVTDPLDGRLLERSITAYRPDARMRAQIMAADVFCRAPGCRVPARKCQLDHETPYIDGVSGGPTSEINLNDKHGPHHQLKTWDIWRTSMDETRRVTWVTLFGRCYVTRAHDYRTYTAPMSSRSAPRDVPGLSDAVGDQDLQDRLIYAALAFRDTDGRLAGDDDHPDNDLVQESARSLHRRAPIQLRHLAPGPRGRRRSGPPPGQRTPEEILTELGADAESPRPEGARPFEEPNDLPPPF